MAEKQQAALLRSYGLRGAAHWNETQEFPVALFVNPSVSLLYAHPRFNEHRYQQLLTERSEAKVITGVAAGQHHPLFQCESHPFKHAQ